ncbi:MAG: ABC transporter permease [Phycisphaerales bacterium JB039]
MSGAKILHVARREFVSTALTKGFIIGMAMPLVVLAIMAVLMPVLIGGPAPKVAGELAVIDPTGQVAGRIREAWAPEQVTQRHAADVEQLQQVTKEAMEGVGAPAQAQQQMDAAMQMALGEAPDITVVELPADTDVEAAKQALWEAPAGEGPAPRLALVKIAADAVERAQGEAEFGAYQLFLRPKQDDRVISELRRTVRDAIIDARIEGAGLDVAEVSAMTRLAGAETREVSETGERRSNEALNLMLPFAYMILLLMSSMMGGQFLMTTVIEEKSSRVVEVLLSAVSPMELMGGKILGQLLVGLLLIGAYGGLGVGSLAVFAVMDLLEPLALAVMIVFFFISYLTIASLMAAIGAAVNELREAQSLLGPIMIVFMIPYLLFLPISRNPDSAFSVACSFIPPINPFAMMLRVASTSPPPLWQVGLSIVIGAATAVGAMWLAAKVFRVGLLMFGKPPNLKTLLRWVRMA